MSFVIDLRALEAADPEVPLASDAKPPAPSTQRCQTMATPAQRRAYIASLDACGRASAAG